MIRGSNALHIITSIFLAMMAGGCKNNELVTPPIDYTTITTIHYTQHVQPIFSKSCATAGCHDTTTKAAGLSLSSWDHLIKGSSFGEVIVTRRPERSLLTYLFDGTPARKAHPSIGGKTPSTAEVQFLKRWISEGAKNDQGAVPYQQSAHKLYVPNQGEDKVAIVDIDNLVVTRYIDVGKLPVVEGPHFIAANADHWYVSLIGAGEVWKFDAHTDTLEAIGKVTGSPALLSLTPDGSKLYVSQFTTVNTNKVTVLSTASMTVVKTITVWTMPHGIRMNHAGTRVYVANMMSDYLSVIDVATDSVIATIPLAYDANPFGPVKYMPMEIAISPNDSTLAVTCSEQQEVRLFDLPTNTLIDSIHVGDQPWHLQFTPDGQFCYVANRRGNSVSMIHIPMQHVMETITTISPVYLNYPHGVDIDHDGRYIFVSNENVGQKFTPRYNVEFVGNVCVIDRALNQIIKVLEVGKMPTGISVGE